MKKILILVSTCLLLVGCGPSNEEINKMLNQTLSAVIAQTAISHPTSIDLIEPTENPTYTPYPTYTAIPTYTPFVVTATNSPTPKFTATETSTPTVTSTSTKTSTPTQTPNTTQTQQAIINATKGADATATKIAQNAKATEMAEYVKIDNRELLTYPDNHVGEKVVVQGRIFNINGNEELQIYLGYTYDAAYIVMREPFSGIYENDYITIYGVILGENCGTNAFGAEICQPLIFDAFYVK